MAQLCPRIDPLRPPQLPRDQPGVLKYAATCMPGTATAGGCADDQKYWSVLIPWDQVTGPAGWTAPGGNRYWATSIPVNLGDPTVKAILRLMADRSRMHTNNVFRNWDDYKNLTMTQVLAKTHGKLATSYGAVTVEIMPDPNETAAAFANRGGYLLWVDPATGVFTSHQPIDWYLPTWVGGDVDTCQLYGYYNLATNRIEYSVRVAYKGTWEKVVEGTLGRLDKAYASFCNAISGEKATTLAVAASLYPGAQAYGGAYAAARGLCAAYMAPPPACEPRTDQPLPPASPTVGGWKMTMTASGSSGAAAATPNHVLDPRILTAATPPATTLYPEGTIAWFDTTIQVYRVAVPVPGDGTTHAIAASQATLPRGVTLVSKREWEKATLPFWRRGSTKIGAMIGGIAVVSLATAAYVGRS